MSAEKEHISAAEDELLLAAAAPYGPEADYHLATAQAHATLALAIATASGNTISRIATAGVR